MLLGLLIITMTACSSFFPTQINKILSNPRDYTDKKVTISGTVEDSFSFVVVKYFTLRDETGEITVVTQKPMPAKGNKIKVTGTVQEAFSLGDQQIVVLIEKDENAK
jgi:hypothetical protein